MLTKYLCAIKRLRPFLLLSLGLGVLLLSSCGKKSDPEPEPYPVFTDRTDHPVTGFFKVTKVQSQLLGREAKHSDGATWRLDEDYLRWHLMIPSEEIICSSEKNPQEYQRLCKEREIRDDIHYFSPSPIPSLWLANGLRSLKLVCEERQTKTRHDLSAQATFDSPVGMDRWFTNARYAGEEILYPDYYEVLRSTLDKMSERAFLWGFWNVDRLAHPYLLVLQKKGIDLSQGRLLLIVEREGDAPLEVELPQS